MKVLTIVLSIVTCVSYLFGCYTVFAANAGLVPAMIIAAPFWIAGTVALSAIGIITAVEKSSDSEVAALLRVAALAQMQLDRNK